MEDKKKDNEIEFEMLLGKKYMLESIVVSEIKNVCDYIISYIIIESMYNSNMFSEEINDKIRIYVYDIKEIDVELSNLNGM